MKLKKTLIIVITVPMLIISVFTYYFSVRLLEDEINRTNYILLNNIKRNIEFNLTDIKKDLSNFVINTGSINEYLNSWDATDLYYSTVLKKDINNFKSKHQYIDDIVIYVKKDNFLLTSYASYPPNYFFQDMEQDNFKECLKKPGFFVLNKIAQYNLQGTNLINPVVLNTTLPSNINDYKMSISIVINENKLTNSINEVGLTKNGYVFIVDDNQKVITNFSNISTKIDLNSMMSSLDKYDGQEIVKISGDKYIITSVKSDNFNWRYIALIPYAEVSSKTDAIKIFNFSILGVLLAVSIYVSFFSSRKLYTPVKNLLSQFKVSEEKTEPVRDEFLFIKNNIDKMIMDNKDMQMKILSFIPSLQNNFLRDLLYDNIDEIELKSKRIQYNIVLPHKYFSVMIFEAVDNITIEKILKANYINYYIIVDGIHNITILNFNDSDKVSEIAEDFKDLSAIIAHGDIYSDIKYVSKSYMEAEHALSYKCMNHKYQYIEYSKLDADNPEKFNKIGDFEKYFFNYLDIKDYESILKHVSKIIDEIVNEEIPIIYIQQNIERLYNVLRKNILKSGIASERTMNRKTHDYLYNMKHFNTLDEYRSIINIYINYLTLLRNEETEKDKELYNNIRKFVDENITNVISLEMVADKFGISYNYLSKTFKENFGESFIDYITRIRIEKAKELLRSTDLKIEEVGIRVGYDKILTFIRNFNKLEGISPGKYRKVQSIRLPGTGK
jgi:AraC-type DNA-binding domain-containing proteins